MQMCSIPPSCHIFMELEFSGQIFEKNAQILYYMNIRADRQT
jgi:hypothetical protein